MHTPTARRSSLFLMELLIAILFFSIAAAVCVRIFVKSYTLEQENRELDHAVNLSASIGEIIRHSKGDLEVCSELLENEYPTGTWTKDTFALTFDTDWTPCDESSAVYTVLVQFERDETLLIGHIDVSLADRNIYSLTVEKAMEDAI